MTTVVLTAPLATGAGARSSRRVVRTRDGVRLAVTDHGPGGPGCPTVVFLHGLCLSQVYWAPQIHSLVRRYNGDVRVISYDHRGHGHSDPGPVASYRPEQLADDLAQVLTSLDVGGPLILVGHSLGGMVALSYLAGPGANRPVDPDGLVLVASAAGRLTERGPGKLLAKPAIVALCRVAEHAPDQALRAMASPVCAMLSRYAGFGPSRRAMIAAVAAAVMSTPVATALRFLPALRSYDAYDVLGEIRARTVIINGEADVLIPPEHSRELAAGIPGAEHISLPGAGHMLPQQAPHVVEEAIQLAMTGAGWPVAATTGQCYGVADHGRSA